MNRDCEVHVCCGVGGAGKTTTAAALAVRLARDGKRVVVLTIDPARRLADALGVELGNKPRPVQGVDGLSALMLDRKGTWDEVVTRFSPSPESAETLLDNRYYRAVSTRLTGSHEYMAIEKLYDLVASEDWDAVVLDTPPTRHALDFFRAPDRVRRLLDRSVMDVIISPRQGLFGSATSRAVRLVNRIAGDRVMTDISEFFKLFAGLSQGFRQRSRVVRMLLHSDQTRYYLVVTAAAPDRSDVLEFLGELRHQGMAFSGFFVNRTLPMPEPVNGEVVPRPEGVSEASWASYVEALKALHTKQTEAAQTQRALAATLKKRAGDAPMWFLPEVEPGTLDGLQALADEIPSL